jgi:hypothetical protein
MKKKTNISDKTLDLINKQKIRPIPKLEFVIKNWGLWLGFIVSLVFLILGTSVSWFSLFDNIITPYMWLFVTIIFLGLSFFLFEKTKRAYRFPKWQIIISIILIGLIIGGIFFKIGLANKLDKRLESRFGFYRQMVPMKMQVWNNPEQGYLSGEITNVTDITNFQIKDFNENIWTITGVNPLIKGRVQVVVGEEIKIIGTKTGDNFFEAKEIRPWSGRGQNMMKEN